VALLALSALLGGCASGGEEADGDQIKELQDRVLELQRKAAVAEVELNRLRQQVAELQAGQGAGGTATGAGGASGHRPAASDAARTAAPDTARTAAPDTARTVASDTARVAAERAAGARPLSPPAGGAASLPARPAGADRTARAPRESRETPAIDEMDIDVPPPPSRSAQAPAAPPPPPAAGTGRRLPAGATASSPPAPPSAAAVPSSPAVPQGAAAVPLPPPASGLGAPAVAGKGEPVTPAVQALYDRGYTLYHQRHYVDAESSFQRFLQAEPNSELADNAQYWIGECRYSRGDMRGALAAFRETVARYPRGNKTPDALLKAGMSLEALGDKEGARTTYREVLRQFPGTAVAAVAEERRAKLP